VSLAKVVKVEGRAVHVPGDDIDTDRIIPARFMKCVTFDGLGQYLFNDVRISPADGKSLNHPLDRADRKGATILISGFNFGCGSSREHAPQALHKFGIRAVIAGNFAEIFFGNSTTLGMPCVSLSRENLAKVAQAVDADAKLNVCIDLAAKAVKYGSASVPFEMKEGARTALMDGQWDPISQLLEGAGAAGKLEAALPYLK